MFDAVVSIQYICELFTLISSCYTKTFSLEIAKYLTKRNLSTKALVQVQVFFRSQSNSRAEVVIINFRFRIHAGSSSTQKIITLICYRSLEEISKINTINYKSLPTQGYLPFTCGRKQAETLK